jgi:hypothetical protein
MEIQPLHLKNELVALTPLLAEHFNELYLVAADPLIWEQHPNPDRYKKEVSRIISRVQFCRKGLF